MEMLEETDMELLLQQILWMEDEWSDPLVTAEPSCKRAKLDKPEATKLPPSHATTRRRGTVNPSRERRKHELLSLRTQEKELSEQLDILQRRRESRMKEHFDDKLGRIVSAAPVWEAVARRQFEAWKKAETTNSQLKAKIAAQTQIINDILGLVQQADGRESELLLGDAPIVCIPDRVSQCISDEEHLQRVDGLMAQWEAVFSLNEKFLAPCIEFYDARVVPTFDRAIVLEVSASIALPFSVERVDETIWKLHEMKVNTDGDDAFIQDHRIVDDAVFGVYTSILSLQEMRGTMNGKFVTKRYAPVPSQRLIVTHTFSEPEGFFNDFDGVKLSENTWVRLIDAHELGHTNLQTPLTLLQYVGRTRITLDSRHRAGSANVKHKTEAFLAHIQREHEWSHEVLEKHLMMPEVERKWSV